MTLSILICSIPSRREQLKRLIDNLYLQAVWAECMLDVQIAYDDRIDISIGEKRNHLLQSAPGKYVCFIDDDDKVASDYISTIMKALDSKPDCLSLRGVITWDGTNPEIFEHSTRYDQWKTNPTGSPIKYERCINHLNVVKASIAKQISFTDKSFGEDMDWSMALKQSGLIKNEIYIDKVLYHYLYKHK